MLTIGTEVQAFPNATNTRKFHDTYVPSTLEKQFVALTLSVGFDFNDPNFGSSTFLLGNLMLCGLAGTQSAANGLTVSAVLDQFEGFLDRFGYTRGLSNGDLTSLHDCGQRSGRERLHVHRQQGTDPRRHGARCGLHRTGPGATGRCRLPARAPRQ